MKFYIFVTIILQTTFIAFCLYVDIQPSTIKKFNQALSEANGVGQLVYTYLAGFFIILASESNIIKESFYCWLVVPFFIVAIYIGLFFIFIKEKINKVRHKKYFSSQPEKQVLNIKAKKTETNIYNDAKIQPSTQAQSKPELKVINPKPHKKKLTVNKSAL